MATTNGDGVPSDGMPGGSDNDKTDRASSIDTSVTADNGNGNGNGKRGDERRFSLSGAGNLSLADVEAVEVRIRSLSVSVNTSPSWLEPTTYPELFAGGFKTTPRIKGLLHAVDADLQPGTLTAIIGGSGSGKTTLLNTMAERVSSSRLSEDGVTTFNGVPGVHGVRHAYVMQQDVLLPTLTVRETLQYSADLRLPPSTSARDRHRVVDEVIRELGLKECADTRIGNTQHRGCSGGEKRRVSIGVQLLANPSVLFLDEPTTGLDATSAFQLVRTLKALARKGRTVITTIHQPRSEIWDLFDNLIVLSRGCPHVIDIAAVDNRTPELEQESSARVEALKAAWREESAHRFEPLPAAADRGHRRRKSDAEKHASFGRQVRVLTDRTLKVTYRDPLGMAASIMEAILMGIVTGYLFFDLGRDQAGIRSREGGLYTAAGLQGYLILIFEVYRMTIDIPTFDRESSEGCVDSLPFVLSRRLARLPTEDVPVPFLFAVLVYFMAGFDRDVRKFFVFFAVTLVNQYVAVTCAMVCVTAVRHFAGASLIANLVYTLQSIACGMFIQVNTIPVYVRWLKWITYTFYAFGAYAGNEFQGSFYDCPEPGGPANPACTQYTGEYVMESLGFPTDWVARPIIILVCFVVLFCAMSALGLRFLKVEMTIARSRSSDTDLSAGKEKMTARSIAEVRAIDLGLDGFALALDKRAVSGKRLPRKTILEPVDATFQAGVLNVIMGPSGSGKTSLLNAMALRLRNSIGTKYRPSGKLSFNGAVPSDSVIRSVCSYVCQDDDALLPSLTVRETLRFAAGLRLPSFMSSEEKYRRAEEVLLKMGLKDCANNLIGSDMIKGISGVLTDPRILLLDEPTSGLDAFTASSIMEVLQGLANEGRTLILTIHQARSDLFKHFGNVLLLARGQDDREAESRERVQKLIAQWNEGAGEGRRRKLLSACLRFRRRTSRTRSHRRRWKRAKRHLPCSTAPPDPTSPHPPAVVQQGQPLYARRAGRPRPQARPLHVALPLLLRRAAINTRRQPQLVLARTMQVVGLAAVFALFFAPLGNDFYSVQNRMGFVQELGAFYFVGMLQNVAVYPSERDVFYREDDDGVYGVDAFLASYTILEVPFEILSCLVFGVLAAIAVGLPRTATMYFVCVFACFGVVSCGESLGIMFNTLFGHTGFAVNIMGIFLSVANGMAGVLSIDMPPLFRAVNYLSPIRYATRAVAPYSLRGVKFTCTAAQRLPDGSCPIYTGEEVLSLYKFDEDPVVNVAAMAACVVVYRLLAWLLLKLMRARWRDKKAKDKQGGK
ncbi:hypothetical protein ACCO45_013763 [Purpureocillium lilacinum]|uniref:Uncharacterized protein n=1 Tax=Purpureocillium lilacinum TaxID=33203 RepID=A0ACC4D945_PURLI